MPVKPPAWRPFGHLAKYPHMARHDIRIWERFVDRFAGIFDEVAYDVALGGSDTLDPNASPEERLMWRFNTAKRIDAAVRNRDECWICEVRPGSGLSAVGAVLGYTILSELDPWTDRPIIMTVVTDHTDGDTHVVCEKLGIQLIELPEPDPGEPIGGP